MWFNIYKLSKFKSQFTKRVYIFVKINFDCYQVICETVNSFMSYKLYRCHTTYIDVIQFIEMSYNLYRCM